MPDESVAARDARVRRTRGSGFKSADDLALCEAYMRVSECAIPGAYQSQKILWECVANQYKEVAAQRGLLNRDWDSLLARWKKISAKISDFHSCYLQAERQEQSGEDEEDVRRRANLIYSVYFRERRNANGKIEMRPPFNHEECWKFLRSKPKWSSMYETSQRHPTATTISPAASTPRQGLAETAPTVAPAGEPAQPPTPRSAETTRASERSIETNKAHVQANEAKQCLQAINDMVAAQNEYTEAQKHQSDVLLLRALLLSEDPTAKAYSKFLLKRLVRRVCANPEDRELWRQSCEETTQSGTELPPEVLMGFSSHPTPAMPRRSSNPSRTPVASTSSSRSYIENRLMD